MKKTTVLFLVLLTLSTSIVFAGGHDSHYSKLSWWDCDHYEYNSSGRIIINYIYQKNGSYNWNSQITTAHSRVDSDFSFFDFTKVTSGYNLNYISYDWGETSWVGIASCNNPKTIRLNDWYEKDSNTNGKYADYDYTELVRVALHEFTHTAGLGHVSNCTEEVMSNASGKNLQRTSLYDGDKAGYRDIY